MDYCNQWVLSSYDGNVCLVEQAPPGAFHNTHFVRAQTSDDGAIMRVEGAEALPFFDHGGRRRPPVDGWAVIMEHVSEAVIRE